MFIAREKELKALEAVYSQKGFGMMVILKYTPESGHDEVGVTPKIGQLKMAV